MTARRAEKTIVVVADDFGRSSSINEAIEEAHRTGIVSAASIMPGGTAFAEAVRIARRNPRLSVGLHVTLCDGAPVLSQTEISGLVDAQGRFPAGPARAWIQCSRQGVLAQVRKEIAAQFDLLEKSGLRLCHVDGHHHLHLQPGVFSLVCRLAALHGVRWIRIPREPLLLVLRTGGRGPVRLVEWALFRLLGFSLARRARAQRLKTADRVCGLAGTGALDRKYLLNCAKQQAGIIEIFAHPDTGTRPGRRELEALCDPGIRESMELHGVRFAGYDDLVRSLSGAVIAGER